MIKPVGGRRNNAVDRVWTVKPGIFSPPTTYVLECKYGLVHRKDIDDFMDVLRWSKEFGVDAPDGRQVKQGVIGVFAGTAFDQKEKVMLKDEAISLASYANRLNVNLLKAADFNEKLREHGCDSNITVQRACRLAKDEREVRKTLEAIWQKTSNAEKILIELSIKNRSLYDFEKILEETS
ncbi:hypothetical protein KEJ51_07655 [Candidatus Bathyarchaeota archaeon]|nr:hypothetical protein [Candidatus Bathyarchaeota archaeon]